MNRQKYNSIVINANYKAKLWMVFAVAMLGSNLLLAYFVVTAQTTEKTIITPTVVTKSFSVTGDEASPEYYEQMSRYFIQLLLTYHKANVRRQFDDVLHYIDPSVYATMSSRFDLDHQRITRTNISSVFHPMKTHVTDNRVYTTGEHTGMVGQNVVSNNQRTYELEFNYEGSGLTITAFNQVKRDPNGDYQRVEPIDEEIIDPEASVSMGAVE